jgi:hypothetical protein
MNLKQVKQLQHNEERAALTCLKSVYKQRLIVINELIGEIDGQIQNTENN